METSTELEIHAAQHVASLMAAAARTAPKTRGIDNIETFAVLDAASRQRIQAKMRENGNLDSSNVAGRGELQDLAFG